MTYRTIPHFIIKNNLQKSNVTKVYFSDIVTKDILKDICIKITGQEHFEYEFVDNEYSDDFLNKSYNKGRLAIMHFQNTVYYITFSEKEINGRNSSIQSIPTAFNMFYTNPYPNKKLCYYFLNSSSTCETNYHILFYRLMSTLGVTFLNVQEPLKSSIIPFSSVDDIIYNRKSNSGKNSSNNSTFITKGHNGEIEIYGKTYGANKYETSFLCYALSKLNLSSEKIKLFEIIDNNLKVLPKSSLEVIDLMGNIDVIPTDRKLEKNIFKKHNSLRSPRYSFNLFNKLGNKRCAVCDCQIPELIQGAHVFPVANIKKMVGYSEDQLLDWATDGENGLWLCENHHKMFDEGMLTFDNNGKLVFNDSIDSRHFDFIDSTTKIEKLPEYIITEKFLWYLDQRKKIDKYNF